ncbi:MAG TPA: hypothetical protein ENN08_05775 [Bacteroidales bacterium]|nr:hypothetical protein [Bacteroidales bacterium]
MNLKLIDYLLKRNYIQIGIVILVAVFAINRFVNSGDPFSKQWELWLEAMITFSIVGMTILIWYNEQRQDWENSLPKKLNVEYKLSKDDVFCTVINAPLSSESDISTWATSIAGTILNQRVNIKFSGFFMHKPRVSKKKGMMIYDLDIFIDENIKGIEKGTQIEFFDNGELDKNSFAVPEENDTEQP